MKHKSNQKPAQQEATPAKTKRRPFPADPTERVVQEVCLMHDHINCATHMIWGLSGWFKAYTQSHEFSVLSIESKGESFDAYEGVKYVLEKLSEETSELREIYAGLI